MDDVFLFFKLAFVLQAVFNGVGDLFFLMCELFYKG